MVFAVVAHKQVGFHRVQHIVVLPLGFAVQNVFVGQPLRRNRLQRGNDKRIGRQIQPQFGSVGQTPDALRAHDFPVIFDITAVAADHGGNARHAGRRKIFAFIRHRGQKAGNRFGDHYGLVVLVQLRTRRLTQNHLERGVRAGKQLAVLRLAVFQETVGQIFAKVGNVETDRSRVGKAAVIHAADVTAVDYRFAVVDTGKVVFDVRIHGVGQNTQLV